MAMLPGTQRKTEVLQQGRLRNGALAPEVKLKRTQLRVREDSTGIGSFFQPAS